MYEIITWYNLNLYNVLFQLYLNKTGGGEEKAERRKIIKKKKRKECAVMKVLQRVGRSPRWPMLLAMQVTSGLRTDR